ncbi:MAG: LptF/LptG family permease [Niabella sp.]
MKKLDKLIIKSFIGPFIATFFITLFVLVMQFFWLWIDDFVGKGLDAGTILKFVWYQSAVLIPLALPLSVLLSSLMTFGNLGETFELVAIKSAGISLLRFMRPLFFVAILISIGAFLFSNYVIPVANLKSRTMLSDIVLAKPAFLIKEGIFNDKLDGFAIKIGTKEANDSVIRDVIVYEQNNSLQDNFIVAKSGIMKPSADKQYLDFHLKDGIRYQERGNPADSSTEFIRMSFKDYKKQLDISSFNFRASEDSNNRNNERVYSMRQLNIAIDSMSRFLNEDIKRFDKSFYASLPILMYKDSVVKTLPATNDVLYIKKNIQDYIIGSTKRNLVATEVADSLQQKWKTTFSKSGSKKASSKLKDTAKTITKIPVDSVKEKIIDSVSLVKDSQPANDTANKAVTAKEPPIVDSFALVAVKQAFIPKPKRDGNSFLAVLPDSAREQVQQRAIGIISSLKNNIEMTSTSIIEQDKSLRRYKIEWHRKIALAMACVVLFMIGAPLGSIIRKGGLGSPLIFAIIFFMIFYFVSTRGEKLAKEGEMSAFNGMWLATYVLVPVGIFLTYKAMHDSNLFNKEFYGRLMRKVKKFFGRHQNGE